LHPREARLRGRAVATAAILVLALVGVLIVALLDSTSPPRASSSSFEGTSSSASVFSSQALGSTSMNSSSGGLTITNMYADVISFEQQALDSNFSSVAGKTTFSGSSGGTFKVVVDIIYQACGAGACPKQVTAVNTTTPGFAVLATTPPLPLRLEGAGGDFLKASFTVDVRAPATPYTGDLTLVVHAG
jgi:hypothetical protein